MKIPKIKQGKFAVAKKGSPTILIPVYFDTEEKAQEQIGNRAVLEVREIIG